MSIPNGRDSQNFLPQSADKLFDQLSEYVLQYGENVLRNLEDLDNDLPEVVQLIEKEGLIERDQEGKWLVTPKGIREFEDKALTSSSRLSVATAWDGTTLCTRARDRSGSRHAAVRLRRLPG